MAYIKLCTRSQEAKQAERYLEWAGAFVVVYSITDLTSFRLAQDYLAVREKGVVWVRRCGPGKEAGSGRGIIERILLRARCVFWERGVV